MFHYHTTFNVYYIFIFTYLCLIVTKCCCTLSICVIYYHTKPLHYILDCYLMSAIYVSYPTYNVIITFILNLAKYNTTLMICHIIRTFPIVLSTLYTMCYHILFSYKKYNLTFIYNITEMFHITNIIISCYLLHQHSWSIYCYLVFIVNSF